MDEKVKGKNGRVALQEEPPGAVAHEALNRIDRRSRLLRALR